MKKRLSVKKILLLLLLFLLLAVIGMFVWIFFLPKKYTVMYHMSGNRTIESAEVILYGKQESGEYGYSMYLLEDRDNLEKIEKALSGMKMYPCHITKLSDITEATAEDRKWLLHLNGKNDTYLSIGMIGTDRKGQSIINQDLMNNGVGIKDYLDIIGNVVVSAEEELNVWETLLNAVKNEIGKITVQDMLELAEEHGVKYTGVIIDNYEDDVSGDVVEQEDVQRFQYFGNMLLHQGGELGYHGYNHQPLSLSNVDYANILPYKTWESYDAMKKAMTELIRFGKDMFPGTELSVYVPPSNVLSDEGREMIVKEFPEIRTIASNYFVGDMAYTQEFEAAEDGIVEQPRIISGAVIDDYMELAAVSELNMHFVNTHFMHPDDLLDEDRGARLGWEKLKKRLDEYMDWLYTSAPCLRNLTASELSGAIQRYGALVIDKDVSDQELNLKLDNFYDEAYIMIRMNEGTPGNIEGGELTHITGNLYLLRAKEKSVKIEIR